MSFFKAFGFRRSQNALQVGSKVPPLVALDQDGNKVDLAEQTQTGLTYLYFYPKASTPGCTLQACDLRDSHARLAQAGIRVIGVSRDKVESQKSFHTARKLPYLLLSDPEGKIIKAFGVEVVFGLALRQSFLIRDGLIVWRDLHSRVSHQADELLRVLPNLPNPK
ncbi:MAG TPA: peroxiredoxin [Candidatus Methylacidiphilales bacterium]